MTKHDKLHLKVQVWVLCRSPRRPLHEWKVLLLKMRKDRGGVWQPVTGSREGKETLKEAALREAAEETGLEFRARPQPLGERFQFDSRWGGRCEEHVFFVEAKSIKSGTLPQVTLDPHEHTDYEWISPSVAERRLGFASNRRMLRILRERLRAIAFRSSVKKYLAKK